MQLLLGIQKTNVQLYFFRQFRLGVRLIKHLMIKCSLNSSFVFVNLFLFALLIFSIEYVVADEKRLVENFEDITMGHFRIRKL